MTLTERLNVYEKLMRLDRPIGILLLLWPTLWGLWLSSYGFPHPAVVVIFVLGVVLMRSAGCIVNDVADRDFDLHVERTKDRPLASKLVPTWEALSLASVLMLLAFLLVLQLNRLTVELSLIAFLLAVIYPFLKRFFWLPQAWLGVAFGFGIPMAFAAHQGAVPPVAWAVLIANMFWAIAYDTEYAMVDRDDDIKLGLKSSAILFGRFDVLGVMTCHALFLLTMAGVGWRAHLGVFYFAGLIAAALLVYYQFLLIRGRQRDGCFRAFLNNDLIGAVIYGGILFALLAQMPPFITR
ncbi:MAG TPA: 4-hydroxybenzoate octaprenyltransferase [Burkholderiales bacterium]|nr:4-hydroxybenzoate octaprenyltransferase [Burkholderiales bacterium]